MHCACVGAECMHEATGNPCHVVCDECMRMKEKCVWPEVVMGSGGTGKGKVVEMSLQAGEKKKQQWKVTINKAMADDNNNMELVEGLSKAGPRPTRRGGAEKRLNWVAHQ